MTELKAEYDRLTAWLRANVALVGTEKFHAAIMLHRKVTDMLRAGT